MKDVYVKIRLDAGPGPLVVVTFHKVPLPHSRCTSRNEYYRADYTNLSELADFLRFQFPDDSDAIRYHYIITFTRSTPRFFRYNLLSSLVEKTFPNVCIALFTHNI